MTMIFGCGLTYQNDCFKHNAKQFGSQVVPSEEQMMTEPFRIDLSKMPRPTKRLTPQRYSAIVFLHEVEEQRLLWRSVESSFYDSEHLTCLNCDTALDEHHKSVLWCSELCNQEAQLVRYVRRCCNDGRIYRKDVQEDGIGVRLLMLHAGGYSYKRRKVPLELRLFILERDNYTCRECGQVATEIDHITGDSADPSNLQALCKSCNISKMEQNVIVITPESHPDQWQQLMDQRHKLVARVASESPLRICDDETNWSTRWQKVRSQRNKLIRTTVTRENDNAEKNKVKDTRRGV